MKYTDEVPTVSGWYWVKRNGKQEIKRIDANSAPNHWKVQLENFIAYNKKELDLGEITIDVYEYAANQPDSFWKTEYYGPLVPPQ